MMKRYFCRCGRKAICKDGTCGQCVKSPSEIPYRVWAAREAGQLGITIATFYQHVLVTGKIKIPYKSIRRGPTGRAIAVTDPTARCTSTLRQKNPQEVRVGAWVAAQAGELGITVRAAWMRFYRGTMKASSVVRDSEGRIVYVVP